MCRIDFNCKCMLYKKSANLCAENTQKIVLVIFSTNLKEKNSNHSKFICDTCTNTLQVIYTYIWDNFLVS